MVGSVASRRRKAGGARAKMSTKFDLGTTDSSHMELRDDNGSSDTLWRIRRITGLHGFKRGSWQISRKSLDTWLTMMSSRIRSSENVSARTSTGRSCTFLEWRMEMAGMEDPVEVVVESRKEAEGRSQGSCKPKITCWDSPRV